ncbi:carbohydrate ABC transporter permease [Paenibacillus sp. HWE-109]|uniref:carbohydrate ABC transporter permease n=1 Tax=Paenibacillus sp. HWE-109 TaxID=1306526 RepID=UPI001EDDBEDF|nr:carbohydrate ABC transporter permease [Paenibacillus sp. HWE-109]UKS27952.1 carbohydrate ABC transporter permease [Paenibacillus sp. HWE-109]
MAQRKRSLLMYGVEVVTAVIALIFAYPIYFIFATTFKSDEEMASAPLSFPTQLNPHNYIQVWNKMHFPTVFANTLLITACSIALLIILGASAAYPLARRTEKVYFFFYMLFICGIMLPFQSAMVPLYKLVSLLHLVNTYHGAILIYIALNLPFTVFLYTGFLKSTPRELEEAAMIDGCSIFRSFWTTIFPLMKPVTATVAVLTSLSVWNDFIVPLLFLNEQHHRTITIELYTFVGEHITNWSLLFPGLALSVTPLLIFFLMLQKFMIKGVAAGSIKG